MKPDIPKILDLKEFLPYRLSVLEQQISRSISRKYADKFQLSRMQWRVLSTLAMFQGTTAKEICHFTHMEKMQVSRAIKCLEDRGLLQQTRKPSDHRAYVLSLTARGESTYQQIVPGVLDEEQRLFSCLEQHERDTLVKLVHKLCLSLGKR